MWTNFLLGEKEQSASAVSCVIGKAQPKLGGVMNKMVKDNK